MKSVTYWDYIKVEELLKLQGGLTEKEADVSNDECLFIVVHQVYELWFKLLLRELTAARDLFRANPVPEDRMAAAVRSFRRAAVILRQAVTHFELIETLTTRDFLAFRDRLAPASGFQSAQLRELEIVLGLEERERLQLGGTGTYQDALRADQGEHSPAFQRVQARLQDTPSLRQVIAEWLSRTPIDGSHRGDPEDDSCVTSFIEKFLHAHQQLGESRIEALRERTLGQEDQARVRARYEKEMELARKFLFATEVERPVEEQRQLRRIRAAILFLESYRELPLLAWPREVLDSIIELEEQLVLFRHRHARMVERVIGRRVGTGGSAGVDYLDQTAMTYRVFRDLWAVRTLLLHEGALPPLQHPERYGFR